MELVDLSVGQLQLRGRVVQLLLELADFAGMLLPERLDLVCGPFGSLPGLSDFFLQLRL